MLPSGATQEFSRLIGSQITGVARQILTSDFDLPDFEQEGDGPTELTFNTGDIAYFDSDSERLALAVHFERMPRYGESYASVPLRDEFWAQRMRISIVSIYAAVSVFGRVGESGEFAVIFELQGGQRLVIEYLDAGDYSDRCRVAGAIDPQRLSFSKLVELGGSHSQSFAQLGG
jgi:hypothetical protein